MSAEHAPASHRPYMVVFVTLLILSGLTVAASVIGDADHYAWPRSQVILVGMAIAVVKATCVALIFMHLKQEARIFYAVAVFTFCLVTILITFTLGDLGRWIYMLVPA